MGPLKDLKIIEIAGIGPAPFCGMVLSDLGAEVIRIDRVTSAGSVSKQDANNSCLLYTSPSQRDLSTSRMPSSA